MTTTTLRINRWCYRCVDCLAVAFAEVELPYKKNERGWEMRPATEAECSICGGSVENMGRVGVDVEGGQTLREVHERCPCDMRCTHARGPHCDCRCQGANHGSQMMVLVEINKGAVPRVQFADDETAKQAAASFRMMRQALEKQIVDLQEPTTRGERLNYRVVNLIYNKREALKKALANRTHAARMDNLIAGLQLTVKQ